jgi:4-amino-4-deoxy-L-arabinose transferase-like glycosyltransferase
MGSAIMLQALARHPGWSDFVRPAWIVLHMLMLSLLLHILDDVGSALAVGYPLLIAAAGLSSRVRLVWLAVACAIVGYFAVWLDAWLRGDIDKPHHLDALIAVFIVTGALVAHQVRRTLALSRFYEHQAPRPGHGA